MFCLLYSRCANAILPTLPCSFRSPGLFYRERRLLCPLVSRCGIEKEIACSPARCRTVSRLSPMVIWTHWRIPLYRIFSKFRCLPLNHINANAQNLNCNQFYESFELLSSDGHLPRVPSWLQDYPVYDYQRVEVLTFGDDFYLAPEFKSSPV